MSIRLLVVEPFEIVRVGLRALFDAPEHVSLDISVIAEIDRPNNLVTHYSKCRADIVVTEVQFPGSTGFEEIDALKKEFPQSKVLVHTASDNPIFLAQAAVIGVDEYIEKTEAITDLVAALTSLHAGKDRPVGHKLNRITERMKSKRLSVGQESPLTGRELQVLRHIAFGMSNKEIARSLKISVDTVKEHVQNILRKIGLRDRTHAAVWAVWNKMI